jgi:hypothetical protein
MDRAMMQRQDSLSDQMRTVLQAATAQGCYDAADWIALRFSADAVEGDRPCLVGRACRAEICRDGCKWPDPEAVSGRGVEGDRGPLARDFPDSAPNERPCVEPSREAGDSTPCDPHGSMLCCGGTDYHDAGCPVPRLEARVVELEEALRFASEAIRYTREYVGEERLPAIEGWSWFDATRKIDAVLAAAGEGEDRPPHSEPDPDQPFHPCACGGEHLTIDHPSGSRLPEPSEGEDPRCATCRDVGAAYCDDCSSRVRPDARSGSRLPEPEDH